MRRSTTLSAAEARRIVLAAQGFDGRKPIARAGLGHVRRLAARLHAFQIDAVNVLIRTQYLPAYSRLGPYPVEALDRLVYERRELFEYLGHAASLLPVELYPLMRWRMDAAAENERWKRAVPRARLDAVLGEVAERGPISAGELSDPGARRGTGWRWTEGKAILEWLHFGGRLAIAGRRGIEQLYDLTERVLPSAVLDAPPVAPDDARRALLRLSARALGVGTARDLADYFRIKGDGTPAKSLLAELVDDGQLRQVEVEGWSQPAYLDAGARLPRAVDSRALVSPFDSLVWERDRTERLFGFWYRIEIYVPAPKRQFGYYVLPFLLGDTLVGRVDLKADRKHKTLVVSGAFHEPDVDPGHVAAELAQELERMAAWLGLERVEVGRRGNLSAALANFCRVSRTPSGQRDKEHGGRGTAGPRSC